MPRRVNLYLSDELAASIEAELPNVNLSAVLAEGLRARLGCRHDDLACARCGHEERRHEIEDQALGRLYGDVLWDLSTLVRRGGTAEGAARIVKAVAERYRVSKARDLPLPRPSRSDRRRQRVLEFPEPGSPASPSTSANRDPENLATRGYVPKLA